MISAFYPPDAFGGDAILIRNLNRELLRRGHEVDVVYCADSYNSLKGGGEARFAELEGVKTHALRSGVGILAPLVAHQTGRPWLHSPAIRRVLDSKPFDVVHFHNISVFGPQILRMPAPAGAINCTQHTSTGWFARRACCGITTGRFAKNRHASLAPCARVVLRSFGAARTC